MRIIESGDADKYFECQYVLVHWVFHSERGFIIMILFLNHRKVPQLSSWSWGHAAVVPDGQLFKEAEATLDAVVYTTSC